MWPLWRCEEFWDALPSSVVQVWPCTTKPVISSTGKFVAKAENTLYGYKMIDFMPKIIRTLSKDHVPWRHFCKFPLVNISKQIFLLVLCIVKNLIWTCLRWFSQHFSDILNIIYFLKPSHSRFSNICISAKYHPIITNNTSMESWMYVYISISMNWPVWLVLRSRVTNTMC